MRVFWFVFNIVVISVLCLMLLFWLISALERLDDAWEAARLRFYPRKAKPVQHKVEYWRRTSRFEKLIHRFGRLLLGHQSTQ